MKRLFFVLAMVACMALSVARAADTSKIDGWISDSMCGSKHVGDNPSCVKSCIKSMGAKPVFVDSAKKAVWTIDNPDAVKAFLGDHVAVTATVDEGKKSVHIDTVEAAK